MRRQKGRSAWPAAAAALTALATAATEPPLHGHRKAEVLLELAEEVQAESEATEALRQAQHVARGRRRDQPVVPQARGGVVGVGLALVLLARHARQGDAARVVALLAVGGAHADLA